MEDPRARALRDGLEERWPALGPWRVAGPRLPAGGPAAVAEGPDAVALGYGPGRLAAERAGLEAASGHPLRPRVVGLDEAALIVRPFGPPCPEPARALPVPAREVRHEGPRRALLEALAPDVRWGKALVALGVRRRDADRWLAAEVQARTREGWALGGVAPGWLREGPDGPVALRWDRASASGGYALELAGLAVGGEDAEALRRRHAAEVGEGADADEAFALATVVAATREARHGDEAAGAVVREALAADPHRGPVRVWVQGPAFVPDDLWEGPGATVSAARARWLLAELDGLAVGGGRLSVRCEPPLRAGRRAPYREARAERRRRLFSRWDEGIEADDEGLVGITPEALALRVAEGATGIVLDGTCGVGALAIAHARQPGVERVVAVDVDAGRLAMARHNAAIYGVEDRIRFVRGDVVEVLRRERADRLVLDPPWGGRGYDRDRVPLEALGLDVAAALAVFDGPVALKLPRSFDVATLPGGPWDVTPLVDDRGVLKMLVARRG